MTQAVAEQLKAILPDPDTRTVILSIFADSMRFIRSRKPDRCIVRLHGKHLRLFTGRLIVLTLEADEVWVTTDPGNQSIDGADLRSWRWDERSYPRYRRVPSRNGYYSPRLDSGGDWELIRHAHHAFLDRALEAGMAPDHRSIAAHERDLADYIDAITANAPSRTSEREVAGSTPLPFDPQTVADTRIRDLTSNFQRQGQTQFRETLLRAYDSTCCFSACKVECVLEAAHIVPYQGPETNHIQNGLLLRADLHRLFDLGLLTVDTATMRIIADRMLRGSTYVELDGQKILPPRDPRDRPSQSALTIHRESARSRLSLISEQRPIPGTACIASPGGE